MFERQLLHGVLLALLLILVFGAAALDDKFLVGEFKGIATGTWLMAAIGVPVLHQCYVWLAWRGELHYRLISRSLGTRRGFFCYAAGFALLFIFRLFSVVALAIANSDTFSLDPVVSRVLVFLLLIPWLYLTYSVHRYFGVCRALGLDHFDRSYGSKPLVREGIFRYTANAMYTFGFLIFWMPGLLLGSQTALLAACFNHAYIWVHYFCTEAPDMDHIYGCVRTAISSRQPKNQDLSGGREGR